MMTYDDAILVLKDYVVRTKPLFGNISIDICRPIDAEKFYDELDEQPNLKNNPDGLYIIWSKNDNRVIYVGISNDIPSRISSHIGPGFSWTRGNSVAHFPNCTLAGGRNWLSEKTQIELQNAEWNVTAVLPNPGVFRKMLESALIFWGIQNGKKPEINVDL